MKKLIRYSRVSTDCGVRLVGVIKDDDRFEDNHRLYTSVVVEEYAEEDKKYAKTETGSIYELGEELSNSEFYTTEKDKGNKYAMETIKRIFDNFTV